MDAWRMSTNDVNFCQIWTSYIINKKEEKSVNAFNLGHTVHDNSNITLVFD